MKFTLALAAMIPAIALAGCEEDCAASTLEYATGCTTTTPSADTCPDGCQEMIDGMYSACGGCANWDDSNDAMKTAVETIGCSPASSAMLAAGAFVASAAAVLLA